MHINLQLIVLFLTSLNLVSQENMNFYIGTYTNKDFSTSEGIYRATIDKNGFLSPIKLVAKTNNPSYLTKTDNQQYIIATNSEKTGTISSFKISSEKLIPINTSEVAQGPCFVSSQNNYVLTANYLGGSVNLHSINTNGELSTKLDTQHHFVSTPSPHKRQQKAFAHSCYFEPNSKNVISVDLGANKLMFWTIDETLQKLTPNTFSELELPLESGPRLLAFHPHFPIIYVVNELSSTVSVIKKDITNNSYKILETVTTLPKEFKEHNTAAHIAISSDARFLYMSNRGHNSIGVFNVTKNGTLSFVERVHVHGEHPRNFSLSPDHRFLLVANRDTNNICSFKRDVTTGKLTFVDEIKAPRATCIIF